MPTARLGIVAALAAGCGGGGSSGPDADDDGFDRQALLRHTARDVLAPVYPAFAARAAALDAAVADACAALEGGDAGAARVAAQEAWRSAVDAWQRADAVLVGPAAMDDRTVRDRIYAWPLVATCGIDQNVAARFADPAGFDLAAELNNVRSLAALEYLLFVADPAHTCAVEPDGWTALGADLPRARCELAAAIATDVAGQADALAAAWAPGDGDYAGVLSTAGDDGAALTEREALNLLSDAFFYVDRVVKDMKLGEAAGIAVNACGTAGEMCLREVEHRHADHGTFALRANLAALRVAFTGAGQGIDGEEVAAGPGFDDYLLAVGAGPLAERMTASLDRAIADAAALPDSYLAALAEDREAVVAVHAATKAFTDDLKTQFLTVLGLEIPDGAAGDND